MQGAISQDKNVKDSMNMNEMPAECIFLIKWAINLTNLAFTGFMRIKNGDKGVQEVGSF